MTSKSARFMVTVNQDIANSLNKISKNNHKSISGVIQDLINEALSLREDLYWSNIAEEAEKKAEGRPTIPAEEVWRKCGLI